jgi:ribosomal protein S18 acetylase RimI-like enzyme
VSVLRSIPQQCKRGEARLAAFSTGFGAATLRSMSNSSVIRPVIRRIHAAQIDSLEKLWLTLHHHHQTVGAALSPYVGDAESWNRRRAFYIDCFAQPGSFAWGAYVRETLVGYTLVRVERASTMWTDTWVAAETTAEIESLVVDPAHRNTGIGTRLMDAVDGELATLGITDVVVGALPGNSQVLELYRRRGFSPTWLIMTRFGSRKKA